jgi:hypothetical protein
VRLRNSADSTRRCKWIPLGFTGVRSFSHQRSEADMTVSQKRRQNRLSPNICILEDIGITCSSKTLCIREREGKRSMMLMVHREVRPLGRSPRRKGETLEGGETWGPSSAGRLDSILQNGGDWRR